MKGVVLAGGLGTRFHPVTKVLNKHLLDVFDEPMVFHPIRTLARTGITDITVVSGDDLDQFKRLLDGGHDLGVNLTYAYQEGRGGIADALARAEEHIGDDLCTVVLGDCSLRSAVVCGHRVQPSLVEVTQRCGMRAV